MLHPEQPSITPKELKDLFAHLNATSETGYECDHKHTLTRDFLQKRNLPVEPTLTWLRESGARCDCEVIFNVEADWQDDFPGWNSL